jgi:N-sulfoglucosamine sulfohydrolase
MKSRNVMYPGIGCILITVVGGCVNKVDNQYKDISRPNILLCIADDLSWMHMGAYGCNWVNTPVFDHVAENGILFTNAYTPNAKCAPSRASILTGRNTWQLEEAANHMAIFPIKFKTFAETLSESDYFVGYTGKGYVPGVSLNEDGTHRELLVNKFNDKLLEPPTNSIYPYDYSANFKDFLDKRPSETPFFFWYGGYEPHRPYQYGSGIELGQYKLSNIDHVPDFWPDVDSVRIDMLDYAYEIEYFDTHAGKMIAMLEEIGELDNTLIIITSDNGMPFPRIKSNAYEMSNHLPLAIMWPKGIQHKGRVVDDFISFIDFAPTFLELAGINEGESGMQQIIGKSLTNIFFSNRQGLVDKKRTNVLIGKDRNDVGRPNDEGYPIRGIVNKDYLYVINFEPARWPSGNPECGYLGVDGSPVKTVVLNTKHTANHHFWELNFGMRPEKELYHKVNDPYCMQNLAESPQHQKIRDSLQKKLINELQKQNDPRVFGEGDIFDSYEVAFERLRNFYERYMDGEPIVAPWVNESDFEKHEVLNKPNQ